MAYTLSFGFYASGAVLANLRAQLIDSAGANVGAAVTTGFVSVGSDFFSWTGSIPDAHQGGVKFYQSTDATTILAYSAINPQEAEYTDTRTSTRQAGGSAVTLPSPPPAGYGGGDTSAIQAVTDKLDTMLESRGGGDYRLDAGALELVPVTVATPGDSGADVLFPYSADFAANPIGTPGVTLINSDRTVRRARRTAADGENIGILRADANGTAVSGSTLCPAGFRGVIAIDDGLSPPTVVEIDYMPDPYGTLLDAVRARTDLISPDTGAMLLAAPVRSGIIHIRAGSRLTVDLPTLGDLTGASALYVTGKLSRDDADSAAQFQISQASGLLVLAGAPAADSTQGSITAGDPATGEGYSFTLASAATDALGALEGRMWVDVKAPGLENESLVEMQAVVDWAITRART